jgi:proteic killer suppression protein
VQVVFKEDGLARIDAERTFTGGYPPAVVNAYRSRIQVLRAAPREQAMLPLKSLRMERHGNGMSQHSLRVTEGWDLIVGFEDGDSGRVAVVKAMVNRTGANTEQPA